VAKLTALTKDFVTTPCDEFVHEMKAEYSSHCHRSYHRFVYRFSTTEIRKRVSVKESCTDDLTRACGRRVASARRNVCCLQSVGI